jgi:hypothetical protein
MRPTPTLAARSRGDMRKTGVLAERRRREIKEAQSGASSSGNPAVWSKLENHLRLPPWRK